MLSRLPQDEEPSTIEINSPILNFDENISDIMSLEEIQIDNILEKNSEAQQSDPFSNLL